MMETKRNTPVTTAEKNKAPRTDKKKFLAVDVWRSQFGPISVRAIYDVFAATFGIEAHNMKKYTLSQCINALRSFEDPDYVIPTDKSVEFVGSSN